MNHAGDGSAAATSPGVRRMPALMVLPTITVAPKTTPSTFSSPRLDAGGGVYWDAPVEGGDTVGFAMTPPLTRSVSGGTRTRQRRGWEHVVQPHVIRDLAVVVREVQRVPEHHGRAREG